MIPLTLGPILLTSVFDLRHCATLRFAPLLLLAVAACSGDSGTARAPELSVIEDTSSGADATDPFADVAFDDTSPDTAEDTSVDTAVEPDTAEDTAVDTAVDTVEDTSIEDTSVDDTSVEDTAVDETSVDDTSVDDTSVDDTAVDDTAVDDTTDTTVEPDTTPVCRPETAWARSPRRAGGAAVFNELGVTPSGGDAGAAWIEIANQQALDLDLSGWRITGSATYTFPKGSMLLGGQQLVVAAATLAPETFGPLTGRLPASGGQLELRNNADRIMDAMVWTASTPWPVIGAGYSLAKKERDSWSALAENWAPSGQVGGTPGAPNAAIVDGVAALVTPDSSWRREDDGADISFVDLADPTFDDTGWPEERGPFLLAADLPVAKFTADNHFALYLGGPNGEGLRLVGRDAVSDWTSVESFSLDAAPGELLWVAAWESLGDSGSPQMVVGEVTRPDAATLFTARSTMQFILGANRATPGDSLTAAAPAVGVLSSLIANAIAAGTFATPAVDQASTAGPWGGVTGSAFTVGRPVWSDTFGSNSQINRNETYALFRLLEPVVPVGGIVAPASITSWFRTRVEVDESLRAELRSLEVKLDAADGAVVYLNGVEVLRENMPAGPIDSTTPALGAGLGLQTLSIPADLVVTGENLIAVEVHRAAAGRNLRFSMTVDALVGAQAEEAPAPPLTGDIVISELMVSDLQDDAAATNPGDWIELHNRSNEPVVLDRWSLVDALIYNFPLGTTIEPGGYLVVAADPVGFMLDHPGVSALGPTNGGLSSAGERLALRDICGVTVDEVRFATEGRWSDLAAGGGSSLELRDPDADNAQAEAWAASEESGRAVWQEIRYRGVAARSPVGNDSTWREFVLGMLSEGEVLLDDLHIVEDPDGTPVEMLEGGDFEAPLVGWRLIGTHAKSGLDTDPDDASNGVLRIVATGSTEHMHNQISATLSNGRSVQNGRTYEISFRARWVAGSANLNTRLYFNRLSQTTRLTRPALGGTPGRTNSRAAENIGPTFTGLKVSPIVPAPDEPVRVVIAAADPEGVAAVTLWTAQNGLAPQPTTMSALGDGRYEAVLPGMVDGTLVQFWVTATDAFGVAANFPAAGPDSRALFAVATPLAPAPNHTVRLLMTSADSDAFVAITNVMSNATTGATLIYDERQAFFDVGVRTKGSERGRPERARLGFNVSFDPLQQLRGVLSSVSLDRSQGVNTGQRELLLDIAMANAGSLAAEYNDAVRLIAPRPEHSGTAGLQTGRFGDVMLENQFANGSDGTVFEYELIYYPTTTVDGTQTGAKLPQPDNVVGTSLTSLGDRSDDYRYNFLIKNNRGRDDFSGIIAMSKAFDLAAPLFEPEIRRVIDVDQWLSSFALMALAGAVDQYGDGAQHNAQLYQRPSDGRMLLFPHDLDFIVGPYGAVVASREHFRLLELPGAQRTYYAKLQGLIEDVYNETTMARSNARLAALLPNQPFESYLDFLMERANFVMNDASDGILATVPMQPFAITTNAGADFSSASSTVVLEGVGWLDVASIRIAGRTTPLAVSWLDSAHWQLTLVLPLGAQALEFEAVNRHGVVVGGDAVTVTVTGP